MIVLTPEGKISRYFFGATFERARVTRRVIAAYEKENRLRSFSNFSLICYHYNPITGKYGATDLLSHRALVATFVAAGIRPLMVGRDRHGAVGLSRYSLAGLPGDRPALPIRTSAMDQFRLFPPQASTMSHEVDALFFALIWRITLFFVAIIFLPIIFFSIKYRRGSKRPFESKLPDRCYSRAAGHWARSFWGWGLFSLGRAHLFPDGAPSGERN